MFEPFSERNREDYPEKHFELTEKIRNQIFFTCKNLLDRNIFNSARKKYRQFHGKDISEYTKIPFDDVAEFLFEAEDERLFDFIEFVLLSLRQKPKHDLADELILRINRWFKLSGCGYEIRDDKFEKVDSEHLKEEAIKPALSLLQKHDFEGALLDFEHAITHQRNEEHEDAIKKANDSFESTMMKILNERNIPYSNDDTASNYIDKLYDDEILDSSLVSFADSVRATLEHGLPTLRNNIPGAGHGRGEEVEEIDQSYCNFALHLAGSLIVVR